MLSPTENLESIYYSDSEIDRLSDSELDKLCESIIENHESIHYSDSLLPPTESQKEHARWERVTTYIAGAGLVALGAVCLTFSSYLYQHRNDGIQYATNPRPVVEKRIEAKALIGPSPGYVPSNPQEQIGTSFYDILKTPINQEYNGSTNTTPASFRKE